MRNGSDDWVLACHMQYEDGGAVCVIERRDGKTAVHAIPSAPARGTDAPPVFLGVAPDRRVFLMDARSKAVTAEHALPVNAVALYAYPEPGTRRAWYTDDGDPKTGNDALNCGDSGASMTVVEADAAGGLPRILGTICVGRGHHVPTHLPAGAATARRAWVSNLLDGTISVVGNEPDAPGYLSVVDLIDLGEPGREGGSAGIPNKSFPHGKVYSPVSGRVYCLNNGYGNIAVIDPASGRIESRIDFDVSSNLLLSPDGRYIIGKGADRKSDPEHVLGRLTVLDVAAGEVVATQDLPDVYPSTYRFNADGTRLYVTTAATGKGAQRERLVIDKVLVYDAAALPRLERIGEIAVGAADCGRRPIAFLSPGGSTRRIFVPNPSAGTLTVADGADDRPIETLRLSERPIAELNFSLLGADTLHGC